MAMLRKDCLKIIFLHFIFLVAVKIIHDPVLVNGDVALIGRVCSITPYPADCHNCLDSNPLSSRVDMRGLAGIAINCSYAAAVDLDNLFNEYVQYGQSQYEFCFQQFDYVVQNVSSALQSWKNNRYPESQNLVTKAVGAYLKCHNNLIDMRYLEPFLVGLAKTRSSCDNAIGILSRIGS
ncbi:hypothetical protein Vadar_010621 [Vaccinium darrowii]|uniref:Uncharacterized protein n=1 Tax=Vaccinium darrowii TaxID=229202 RepID=A0ACB7Z380_9ERIC|nr:hypothetical protein Vadar_010621 [Vaccinium darrowii]